LFRFSVCGPGALQKSSGTCFNASGVLCASKLHVKMGETIGPSIIAEHPGIFTIWGIILPASRGKHIPEKRTRNEKRKAYKIIKLVNNKITARSVYLCHSSVCVVMLCNLTACDCM